MGSGCGYGKGKGYSRAGQGRDRDRGGIRGGGHSILPCLATRKRLIEAAMFIDVARLRLISMYLAYP